MSDYLDDMNISKPTKVFCVANICQPHFTVGKTYLAFPDNNSGDLLVEDDSGYKCRPSGRFSYQKSKGEKEW